MMSNLSVVTGAFGYTGKYIAQRLLDRGETVRSLTRNPAVVQPLRRPGGTPSSGLRRQRCSWHRKPGVELTHLYNTFWVRFSHGAPSITIYRRTEHHANWSTPRALPAFGASYTSASPAPMIDSPLPYFRGKATGGGLTSSESGLIHWAIIRPTIIFRVPRTSCINNIAWFLRRFPVLPRGWTAVGMPCSRCLWKAWPGLPWGTASSDDQRVSLDAVGPETLHFPGPGAT